LGWAQDVKFEVMKSSVQSNESQLMFWMNMSPPPSELKSKPSKKPVRSQQSLTLASQSEGSQKENRQ
jgi:hypothetical protein